MEDNSKKELIHSIVTVLNSEEFMKSIENENGWSHITITATPSEEDDCAAKIKTYLDNGYINKCFESKIYNNQEILKKFETFIGETLNLQDRKNDSIYPSKIHKKNYDAFSIYGEVVNGYLYLDDNLKNKLELDPDQDISFVSYPFRVFYKKDSVILLGLKKLYCDKWKNCIDKQFKIILHSLNTFNVYTAHIPTADEIIELNENDRAIGNCYWTSTEYVSSQAYNVYSSGGIDNNYKTGSYGVVPYIKIPL